jgi:DNA mismatch endonuclease, patch repair protein
MQRLARRHEVRANEGAMMDIVSPEKRSEMMSGIRAKNTKPEMLVRRALFSCGYRYRLHRKDLPGTPDLVLPGRRVAIFVHGCFWHGHAGCSLAKIPGTREDFWKRKFELNRHRDDEAVGALLSAGWRVLIVWECFVRSTKTQDGLATALSGWLESATKTGVLQSTP